jgi:hypothetical protein
VADPYERVSRGAPLAIRADTWNALLDAARAYSGGKLPGAAVGKLVADVAPSVTVLVRNDTGGALSWPAVLALGDPEISAVDYPHEVQRQPLFSGDAPASPTDAFALMVEPLADGKIGVGVVAGVAVCEVAVSDAGHAYAVPETGETARLASAPFGPAKIVWKESGTGNKRAVVIVGQGGSGDEFDAEITGGSDAAGYSWKRVELTGANTWTDATEPAPLTGTNDAYRMPSASSSNLPAIPAGQVVPIRPSPTLAGKFEIRAWGGRQSSAGTVGPFLTDVSLSLSASAVCNVGGTITVTVTPTLTKTYSTQTLTVVARDLYLTLPAPA